MYQSSNPFTFRVSILLIAILLTAAAGGLGLLWLRQEISQSASLMRRSEQQLAETGRRLQYVNVKIAEATTPESLKQRAQDMRLGLVAPSNLQLVRLEAPRPGLGGQESAVAQGEQEPMFVTFELALIRGPSGSR